MTLEYIREDNNNQDYYQFEFLRDKEVWGFHSRSKNRKLMVSTFGRRKACSLITGKISEYDYGSKQSAGYKVFGGFGLGHVCVAQVFIPNPENKRTVNHINGKQKTNNNIANLEWFTYQEQSDHAWGTGLHTRTPEGNRKRSESQRDNDRYIFINEKTGETIETTYYEATRSNRHLLGLSKPNVSRLKTGKYRQTNGWICLCVLPS